MASVNALLALSLALAALVASGMKMHAEVEVWANASRKFEAMSCSEMGATLVKSMVEGFERSKGYDAVMYRGCLKFLKTNSNSSRPAAAQMEKLGEACKSGQFREGDSVLTKVDPSHLASECDRAVYNMDVQLRLLGDEAFKTSEGFCATPTTSLRARSTPGRRSPHRSTSTRPSCERASRTGACQTCHTQLQVLGLGMTWGC